MEGSKIYFTACLLSTLYTVCTAYCPSSQLSYKDCSRYYNAVEHALLKDQDNKYQLHEEFFPSSHSAPFYGYVRYTINLTENGVPYDYDFCIPWSSSVLLAYIDPFTLSSIQLGLMEFLFHTMGMHYLTDLDNYFSGPYELCDYFYQGHAFNKYDGTIVQLTLTLDLDMDIPYKAAEVVLMDLTSWLKVYARALDGRESWGQQDYQYKGYSTLSPFPFLFPTITSFFSTFLYSIYLSVVGFITMLLVHLVPEWYRKATARVERGDQWYSFFWALSFVASLCNTAVIACEIYTEVTLPLSFWLIIVFPILVIIILFDLVLASCIRKDPAFPIPRTLTFLCACCRCSVTSQSKLAQTLALWNFLMLIHFVAVSAVPTLLWMFVLPVQILAVTALLVTTVFFATALIAFVIKYSPMLRRRNTCRENCTVFLPVLSVGLFLALVIQASVFYINLINTGVDPNSLGKFIAYFFPSAVLTVVGWFVTKGKLFNKLFQPPDESNRNTSAADKCANDMQRAEEGLVSESTPLLN